MKTPLLKAYRSGRWGRLQRQCSYCFIAHSELVTTQQLAEWCYPRIVIYGGRPNRWQIGNQARAAKSIGAVPIRREGREWVWKLPQPPLDVDLEPDDAD